MNAMRFFSLLRAGLVAACVVLSSGGSLFALPAFPGAEGFGANATGGRGASGTVYHVTNLNDSGLGSFRDAVSVANRTVVFDVGGIITLTSGRVAIKNNITIAGQTAPGGGITIYGNGVSFSSASNTICRYIRFRQGINGESGTDAVGIASGNDMIFDHVSASWGRDETFSISGSAISNITLQDCIISQGLLIHSAGGLIQTSGGVSIFRSLYADNYMRNPKVKGVNDFINNVVYNWGSGGGYIPAGDSAGDTYANMIGCWFIGGPTSGLGDSPFKTGNLNYRLYHSNNYKDTNIDGVLDEVAVTDADFPTLKIVNTPFTYPAPAITLTPQQAFAHVLANAGASLHRDYADNYVVNEVLSLGTVGAHIANESAIGGVGTVAGGLAPTDTDGDGMPDWWESAAGTNPAVADNNGDLDGDGYSNLENYINSLGTAGLPGATITAIVADTGAITNDGNTSDNTLQLTGSAVPNSLVTVSRAGTGVLGTVTADAAGQWAFDYSGTVLPDNHYVFSATATVDGKTSTPSKGFVVRVDTTPAAAPAITSLTTTPAYAFSGTAEPFVTVNVSLDGTGTIGTTTADAFGNWSAVYTGLPLTPGVHTFSATAVDLAGNAGAASAAYVVDTSLTPPVFTGIVSDTGLSANDQITYDTSLIVNGTAPANSTVAITRAGTGVIGTALVNASGIWTFDYTATTLAAGQHTFTATASAGGSSSPASLPFLVTIDTAKPTMATSRFNPSAFATSSSTVVFRATMSEPVINVDVADFSLTKVPTTITGSIASVTQVSPSVYDVTVTGVSGDGTIRLDRPASATITDYAGNTTNTSFSGGQLYTLRLPGSGVWTNTSSGNWSDTNNWEAGVIANNSGATADISTLDLSEDAEITLDSPRTLGRLIFADADQSSPATWMLTDAGNTANVITFASSGVPTLQVNYSGGVGDSAATIAAASVAYPAIIDVSLAGTQGLTKAGGGTALFTKPVNVTGVLALGVSAGNFRLGTGSSYSPTGVTLGSSSQVQVAGGSFTTGTVTIGNGGQSGVQVYGGTATITKITTTGDRDGVVRVTGGTLALGELTFPRTSNSESEAANFARGGLIIQGGSTTIGTMTIPSGNSWSGASIEGGELTVTGAATFANQATATRGAVVRVTGGRFNVTEPVNGLVLSKKYVVNTTVNANNIAKINFTGGVSTLEKLTLGFDSTVNAGSVTVTLDGGALYLGSGGIVKNGASGLSTMLTLTAGTLGAKSDWSTNQSFALTAGNTIAIKAADESDVPHDIMLSGALFGAGGITKTGAGTLILTGTNTYTGTTSIDAGILRVDGSLTTGAIQINATGMLTGTGSINVPILLNDGGSLLIGGSTPDVFLGANNLTWADGGSLFIDVGANGASDRLVLAGALSKGGLGTYVFVLNAGAGFAAGNTYTLATFASTDFNASDFSAVGLPAGFAGKFTLNGTELQVTIVGTPFITSSDSAAGMFGSAFSTTITSGNVPDSFSASSLPPGLVLDTATGVISGIPTAAGTYVLEIGATNIAGTGTASLTITIAKAPASVTLTNLLRSYTGQALNPTATTEPADLNVVFAYDGSNPAPIYPGTYAVVATIDEANYEGSAAATFKITATATVRHAPTLNGDVDGSVQMFSGEWVTLNGGAMVSLDLLVPGTPTVRLNGKPTYGGTIDATGLETPAGYGVTLNGGAVLRRTVRRIDPLALPVVTAPAQPTGTRYVYLNRATDVIGDFATLRSLTLNGTIGAVVIPAGTYGDLTSNGNNTFVLGVAGATEPAVYNLQRLTMNGNSTIQIVGPVVLRLANGVNFNGGGISGSATQSFTIEIASGDLTLNGSVTLNASVVAPAGRVTINGSAKLNGRVVADNLTLNGNGQLNDPEL